MLGRCQRPAGKEGGRPVVFFDDGTEAQQKIVAAIMA